MTSVRWRLARRLLLVAGIFVGCQIDKLIDAPSAPHAAAARLTITTQPVTMTAGTVFTVAVAALDSAGHAVPAFDGPLLVEVASNPAGATLHGTPRVTAEGGVAQFTDLMMDKASPGYTIRVSSDGLAGAESDSFTVVPAAPARIVWAVQPSAVPDDSVMRPPVKVSIFDAFDNLATNYAGVVTLALGRDGSAQGRASLSGTTTVAVTAGVVTFEAVKLDEPGTGYTLRAVAGPVASESAPFDVIDPSNPPPPPPPAATHLAFSSQPSSAQTGASLGTVRVSALDVSSAVVTGFTGSITIALGANPGGGTLAGTATAAAVSGVATFSNLSIDKVGTGYTLTAASSPLSGTTSSAFNVTATPPPPPPPATHLAFTVQPSGAQAGSVISPAVRVSALDASNNVVTGFTGSITVAIGANPAGGTLLGTVTAAAVNGVATFSNLSINNAGSGYTLSATSAGLTGATSGAFNITTPTPPPATHLAFTVQPSSARAGSAIQPPVQVSVLDDQGHVVTGFSGSVTVVIGRDGSLLGGAGLHGTTTVTVVSGVATFSDLSIDTAGTGYTLNASAAGLTAATSASFNVTLF